MTSDSGVVWLAPIFTNAGGDDIIGVSTNQEWLYLHHDDAVAIASKSFIPPLLPMLQPGYGGSLCQVTAVLESRLEEVGLPRTLASTFPFRVVVLTAFKASEFWIELSFAWIPNMSRDEEILANLREFSAKKGYDQRLRHRARELAKILPS